MALEQYANDAATTLNGAILSGATSLIVTDASKFPSSGNFRIKIESEIMLVTAVSSNTFTVTRAQEGTSAASHADTLAVNHLLTKASLLKLIDDSAIFDTLANLPAAGRAGRIFRPTDLLTAVYHDNGSSWDKYYPGRAVIYPPFTPAGVDDEFDDNSFTGWTLVDDGTHQATVTEQNDHCSILFPGSDTSAHVHAWLKAATISAGDIIEICFRAAGFSQNFNQFGLIMSDGVTYNAGTNVIWIISFAENAFIMNQIPNFNSNGGGTTAAPVGNGNQMGNIFMRLKYNGSNSWSGYISPDGISWVLMLTASKTCTPAYVGFVGTTWGGTHQFAASMKYFRKTT